MQTYQEALAAGSRAGASKATDAEASALFLSGCAQTLLGAVSPKLIWEGTQKKHLTYLELARLVGQDPDAARDLMWVES
jgi:hypothetical protein